MKWFKKKRIIVPFDYSDDSLRAIRVGQSLAEKKQDVHVVHVLHDLGRWRRGFLLESIEEQTAEGRGEDGDRRQTHPGGHPRRPN